MDPKQQTAASGAEWTAYIWSLNSENGFPTESLFAQETPEKDGPYRYDWAKGEFIEGPQAPKLRPWQREALAELSGTLRREKGFPFACRVRCRGARLEAEALEPLPAPGPDLFDAVWKAEDGAGLRTGSPFKTSLYAAARREGLKLLAAEAGLLTKKDGELPRAALLYGRAYGNLSLYRRLLERLPDFSGEGFAAFYGLAGEGEDGKRLLSPRRLVNGLKFSFAGKRLPGGALDFPRASEKWASMEKLYGEALEGELPMTKLVILWYQLINGEFFEAQGARARQELTLAHTWLRARARDASPWAGLEPVTGLPELSQLKKLWLVSRRLRQEGEAAAKALLTAFFPEAAADRRFKAKLSRDLEFLAELDDARWTGRQDKACEPSAEPLSETGRALLLRETLAGEARRFYRLILRYCDELSGRLEAEGVLSQARDWRFLKYDELQAYLSDRLDAVTLREFAGQNRQYYFSYRKFRSPDILGSRLWTAPGGEPDKGLPASPGLASGRACVCASFDDLSRFEPGDVLVTRATDVAWGARLAFASAVVTTEGGLFSHAAILARALGIPCVTAWNGRPEAIPAGTVLTVDGGAGLVSRQEGC